MADDEWQLEAVHEQFNVIDSLTTPCEKVQSLDFCRVMVEVEKIRRLHLKMDKATDSPRNISAEIIKHPDGNEIKLSFIVIVTNIKMNGKLSKMPVFVIMSGGKNKFIDMNCTLFKSWDAFLNHNDFPPCQYCFPVGGQYCVGGKLKIDFASSPAAITQNVNLVWKGLGFVLGVGIVVGSFFFTIPPINHSRADSLLSIANEFVPGIKKYLGVILKGVAIITKLKEEDMDLVEVLPELWNFLKFVKDDFSEEISWVYQKVQSALEKLYKWLREKLSFFFENASPSANHMFIAVTSRVDEEIVTVDSEAEEILEASVKNNRQSQTTFIATPDTIHPRADNGGTGYANTIFENAKKECALQNGIKNKDNENLHPVTSDLLDISSSLAEKLGKITLNDHQNIFEALSRIVKDEYKNKIESYAKMLAAAKAGAGHQINLTAFNCSLGIEGDIKEYFWQETMISVVESRLVYRIKEEMERLEKQKKLLILPLCKQDEDDVPGFYKVVGVYGAHQFNANDLIKALKESQIDLDERDLVINETSSKIMIRTKDLTLLTMQELNTENTSEGMLWVIKTEL